MIPLLHLHETAHLDTQSLPLFGAEKLYVQMISTRTRALHVTDLTSDQQCENVKMDSGEHNTVPTKCQGR